MPPIEDLFDIGDELFVSDQVLQAAAKTAIGGVAAKHFVSRLPGWVNSQANLREGVIYARYEQITAGCARVEFHSKGTEDDCLLVYCSNLKSSAGIPMPAGELLAWHLPSWEAAPKIVAEFYPLRGAERSPFDQVEHVLLPGAKAPEAVLTKTKKAA